MAFLCLQENDRYRMSHPRFLVPAALATHTSFPLQGEDEHYLCRVLRLKVGDELALFDGLGWEGRGVIEPLSDGMVQIRVASAWAGDREPYRLTLCQSLPKGDKMDLIVQKATELGVSRIIPIITARTISRPSGEQRMTKVERWRRIAQAAARQSQRLSVPELDSLIEWDEFLGYHSFPEETKLVLWEKGREGLKNVLERERRQRYPIGAWVLIGPEGGFEEGEIAALAQRGYIPVSLGHHILRTETAALTICALLQYEAGRFSFLTKDCG